MGVDLAIGAVLGLGIIYCVYRFTFWSATSDDLIKALQDRYDVCVIVIGNEENKKKFRGGKHDGAEEFELNLHWSLQMKEYHASTVLYQMQDVVEQGFPATKAIVPDYPEDLQ